MRTVIDGAALADGSSVSVADGHIVIEDGLIAAVGPGAGPGEADRRVDGRGCLVTPGFVNTHHHLYQWATRGYAADSDLFTWLVTLYPVWARLDASVVGAAAAAGLARLARTGCTTVADHHYVFPRSGGDVFGALIEAGARIGTRLEAVRGSMDRGESQGGLPPDSLVETLDGALSGTAAAIAT
jgi:8-oxoguanine deaminase